MSRKKMKKIYAFGSTLDMLDEQLQNRLGISNQDVVDTSKDAGLTALDIPLGAVGLENVIDDKHFETNIGKSGNKVTNITSPVTRTALQTGLAAAGVPTPITSTGQQFIGQFNPEEDVVLSQNEQLIKQILGIGSSVAAGQIDPAALGSSFALGGEMGLTELNGPTHEQGGIQLAGGNEVEGGETKLENYIFSDRINVPNSKMTFAEQSKKISKKYKDRETDTLAQESKQRELENLMNLQESVRQELNVNVNNKLAMGGPFDPNLEGLNDIGSLDQSLVESTSDPTLASSSGLEGFSTGNGLSIAGFAASNLGNLFNLRKGLQGPEIESFQRVQPATVDFSDSLDIATNNIQTSFDSTNRRINEASNTRGQLLANRAISGLAESQQLTDTTRRISEAEENENARAVENAARINARIQMLEENANAENRAATDAVVSNSLTDIGQGTNTLFQDIQQNRNQNIILDGLKTGQFSYAAGDDGKPVLVFNSTGQPVFE